jgi:MoxR-like ATPase
MMALLGLSNAKNDPDALKASVQHAILSITTPVLQAHPALLARLKTRFPLLTERLTTPIANTFSVVPSHHFILSQLQTCLALRDLRVNQQDVLNEAQLYGGLGGMVLEGEPGCGKSELIVHTLVAAGYEEEHNHHEATQKVKPFYKLPASMGLNQKKALLLKAFHEGAVVLMDEINSSPMMEQTLNAILMGFHPDTHKRPEKPGFMVIGTQNPISMAGRRVASPALRRRLTMIEAPEYTKEELIDVLMQQKNLSHEDASLMVETYLERRDYAKQHHITPIPCFRDLYSLADQTTPASTKETSVSNHITTTYRNAVTDFREDDKNFATDDINWNFYLKCLSHIALIAGAAILVVGLLLPIPGLAIAGACLLGAGVALKYASSRQGPEDNDKDVEQSFRL